jgi:coenzyme F420-reducing hydrogenase alpha subunit
MTTLTFPLSRIEGHAQVVIEMRDGEVHSAHFKAMELRGFEHFLQGTPAEEMPVIVPRICGVCSTAHHLAAVGALEDAYQVTPPPLAIKIRELMYLGQLIQNQATSLFVFTLPDRLGLTSIFERAADAHSEEIRARIARWALTVRKAGTDLITLAGGQFIHPIKAVVGGVTSGIGPEAADEMHTQLEETLPLACELYDHYWETSLAMGERLDTWGDDSPTYYVAALGGRRDNYYSDVIRVMSPDGVICDSFHPRDFRDYLTFEDTDYSYAGRTSYKGELIRANSLARVNMGEPAGTVHTDQYLRRFRETFGRPAHAIMLFDLARGVELVYSLERALAILEEPLDNEDTDVPHTPRDGDGYGLVEAPRGPLIHHYHIEKGLITQVEFIIPTVHNVRAIERALRVAAERYINADRVDMELERAVGRVVRAFDPCIACATH